ncbi:MAG TPA: MaoC family dehydratase [Candidatus Dormibacteraeota bacterium]
MERFESPEALRQAAGTHLGQSAWRVIDQDQVNRFADATGDHQWIHVDLERAAAGPFGGTIAHGFLTLSMLPEMVFELLSVGGVRMVINYGLNRVRFVNPVRVGSRVRAGAELTSVEEVKGGLQALVTVTFEIDGEDKPACVAESLMRFYV